MSRRRTTPLSRVLERNGWKCHICGHEIPRDAAPNTPLSPTRDHVYPRGSRPQLRDGREVLFPAHKCCNEIRGCLPLDQLDRDVLHTAMAGWVEAVR